MDLKPYACALDIMYAVHAMYAIHVMQAVHAVHDLRFTGLLDGLLHDLYMLCMLHIHAEVDAPAWRHI